jgi:hypothetical protein
MSGLRTIAEVSGTAMKETDEAQGDYRQPIGMALRRTHG